MIRNAEALAQTLDMVDAQRRGEWLINDAETLEAVRTVTWESLAVS